MFKEVTGLFRRKDEEDAGNVGVTLGRMGDKMVSKTDAVSDNW